MAATRDMSCTSVPHSVRLLLLVIIVGDVRSARPGGLAIDRFLQDATNRRRAAPQLGRDLADAPAPLRQEVDRAALHLP